MRIFITNVDVDERGREEPRVGRSADPGAVGKGGSAYSLRGLSGFSEYVDMIGGLSGQYRKWCVGSTGAVGGEAQIFVGCEVGPAGSIRTLSRFVQTGQLNQETRACKE